MLARVVDLRIGETKPVLLAAVYFYFLLASYFVLRPIRDTLSIAAGVSRLPYFFVGTLTATLICQPLFAALVARFPVRKFIPLAYQFFALNLLGFWIALTGSHGEALAKDAWLGRVFFVWISVFNLLVVSVFWAFLADRFRTEQAKRLFGFIGVGGTLGGLTGLWLTATLVRTLGAVNLLLVSLAFLEIATLIVIFFPKVPLPPPGEPTDPAVAAQVAVDHEKTGLGGGIWAGITRFAKSPFLLGIGGFLALYTVGSTTLYFQQTQIVGAHVSEPAERTRLLAQIEFASQLITVVIQAFLTGRIIRAIGLPATLALMPALSVVGFIAMGLSGLGLLPTLGVFIVFGVLRRGTNFALTNPAMEALYTVVPREDKYKAKSFIETFIYRVGDQVAAFSYAALAALGFSATSTAWPQAVLATAAVLVGVWIGRRHRALAAESG